MQIEGSFFTELLHDKWLFSVDKNPIYWVCLIFHIKSYEFGSGRPAEPTPVYFSLAPYKLKA